MFRFKLLLFHLGFVGITFGSALQNGFQALKIHDYFKAKKIFQQNLKRQPAASGYGLASIYYRNDNPFHNLDSAYKYVMQASFKFNVFRAEDKQKLIRYSITDSTLQQLCNDIFSASYQNLISEIQKNNQNTIELAETYLRYYEFSSFCPSVKKLRDDYLLTQIKKSNSSESYQNFMIEWPECLCKHEILYLLEKSIFEEETALQTPESYLRFLENHPETPFKIPAQEALFLIYKETQNAKKLYEFIKKFPANEHIPEAWKLFFTLSVEHYNPESLAEFIFDYPEFPFKNSIIQEIQVAGMELIRVNSNDKFGFIDTSGNWVVTPDYEELTNFQEGLAVAVVNEKYGYINKKGEWIISPNYDEAENFQNGVAIVIKNDRQLLIDRNGETITADFDEINNFSNGLAVVKKGNKCGAINRLGKIVIPLVYEKLNDFKNEHAVCSKDGKFGIIDKNNYLTIKPEYDWIEAYSNFIRAKKNGNYGLLSAKENTIIPFEFERIDKTDCGIFLLVKNGKYGFAEESGCLITDINNDFDSRFQVEDLYSKPEKQEKQLYLKIYQNEKPGIVNQNGKVIIEPGTYDDVSVPSNGMISVFRKGKFEFYDIKQTKMIRQKYDQYAHFFREKAIVKKNDKMIIIDKNGKELFTDICEKIERLHISDNYYFLVTKKGLKGLLTSDLKWLIPAEFELISWDYPNFITLQKDEKNNVFSISQNKIIWKE